ncbi:MAG: trypsin-like peptidase domain-containing protein [Oligoflexia bacterium]|nr:trypsin-like peptidase domain-containing protein [Oligoflexia bacterium]MBF0364956.1 trypsin-like peptidase domain-containing protein [Oligoflexia bacterium]
MKKVLFACLFSSLVTGSLFAGNSNKVIYGDDNRVDYYASTNTLFRDYALATAAQVPIGNISKAPNGMVKVSADNLRQAMNVCSSERFAEQVAAANCSGFIVAPDVLITAGHCVTDMSDCSGYSWVFDYRLPDPSVVADPTIYVPDSSVYKCTEIIGRKLEGDYDYAVLRLDRNVTDRAPLSFRRSGELSKGTPLVVIGHPSGLPTKISDGAVVRAATNPGYFVTNLDTYGGNSGSAVINVENGEVEGILVRGDTDYVYASGRYCMISKRCTDDGCRGEDVTRITVIPEIK